MDIPRQVLDVFKQILGSSTLQDDPMDFNRIPKIETKKVETQHVHRKR